MKMSDSVPGTTIQRTGPAALDRTLATPATSGFDALRQARSLLTTAQNAVSNAQAAVAAVPGHPSSWDATITYLRGRLQAALGAAGGSDPYSALARVRDLSSEVQSTSAALMAQARGVRS